MTAPALAVDGLSVAFATAAGSALAVDGVGFALMPGERLGLVGESGSGKSTTVLALMRLIRPPGRIVSGRAILAGKDMLSLPEAECRRLRFAAMSLVPQGAMSALNPVLAIRRQFADLFAAHGVDTPPDRIVGLLARVGLPAAVADRFPHELSGGMKQRVCIALAIALEPAVILADEPTSALDVVVQKQVLATLGRVQREIGAAILLIGHDMALMAQFVDRIGVMYAGRLVELGPVREVFRAPRHPYTRLLLDALPRLDARRGFRGIPGVPPSLVDRPRGCAFHARCPMALPSCRVEDPPLVAVGAGHDAACLRAGEMGA
jgi:peptide/nickel transport system ATP-binding protein